MWAFTEVWGIKHGRLHVLCTCVRSRRACLLQTAAASERVNLAGVGAPHEPPAKHQLKAAGYTWRLLITTIKLISEFVLVWLFTTSHCTSVEHFSPPSSPCVAAGDAASTPPSKLA